MLKAIFDTLDDARDGEIKSKEFTVQLRRKFNVEITVAELEEVMNQIDLNSDGTV